MKGIHPKVSHLATLAAIALSLGAAGCRNPSGGVANPFLAPDRVPPPATRAIMPGQAQPYYPGDPLPMQSGIAPQADASLAAADSTQMPSADGNLAWASPRSAPPTNAPAPTQVVASAEPSVTIPTDGDALRFALPSPPEPQPFTPTAPVPIAAPQQPIQLAVAPPPTQGVLQASYEAPVIGNAESMVSSPWRTPQVVQPNVAPTNYAQPLVTQPFVGQPIVLTPPPLLQPTYSMPPAAVSNSMDVNLRAVPSPEPVSPSPRIRIPGYDTSPPMIGSYDGFRPRSSMK